MAEGVFRKAAEKTDIEVSSAGVAAQPGSSASRETISVLKEQGAELESFRSRMVDGSMLEEADAVFCMTEGHLEMLEICKSLFFNFESFQRYGIALTLLRLD